MFVDDVPGEGIVMATEEFQRWAEDNRWEKAVTAARHPAGDQTEVRSWQAK